MLMHPVISSIYNGGPNIRQRICNSRIQSVADSKYVVGAKNCLWVLCLLQFAICLQKALLQSPLLRERGGGREPKLLWVSGLSQLLDLLCLDNLPNKGRSYSGESSLLAAQTGFQLCATSAHASNLRPSIHPSMAPTIQRIFPDLI